LVVCFISTILGTNGLNSADVPLSNKQTNKLIIGVLFFSQPSAENVRCQKCLEKGHWTYECTGKRKYVFKESRTKTMSKTLRSQEQNKSV